MPALDARVVALRRAYLWLYRAGQLTDDGATGLAVVAIRRGGAPCPTGTALPSDFPARSKLIDAEYTALEDLVGADEREPMLAAGLTPREAKEALVRVHA